MSWSIVEPRCFCQEAYSILTRVKEHLDPVEQESIFPGVQAMGSRLVPALQGPIGEYMGHFSHFLTTLSVGCPEPALQESLLSGPHIKPRKCVCLLGE